MKKQIARVGFMIIVFCLFLQLLFIKIFKEEPYPAIILPGFRGAAAKAGVISMTDYEITGYTSAGDSFRVERLELLNSMFPTYSTPVMETIISKEGPDQETQAGITDQLHKEDRDRRIRQRREFKQWVKRRINEQYGKSIERLRISRQSRIFNTQYGVMSDTVSNLKTVEISL